LVLHVHLLRCRPPTSHGLLSHALPPLLEADSIDFRLHDIGQSIDDAVASAGPLHHLVSADLAIFREAFVHLFVDVIGDLLQQQRPDGGSLRGRHRLHKRVQVLLKFRLAQISITVDIQRAEHGFHRRFLIPLEEDRKSASPLTKAESPVPVEIQHVEYVVQLFFVPRSVFGGWSLAIPQLYADVDERLPVELAIAQGASADGAARADVASEKAQALVHRDGAHWRPAGKLGLLVQDMFDLVSRVPCLDAMGAD
jgi:hypothetical protein